MTDRKFTPPTEFPAEYVTSDGRKAVILGRRQHPEFPFVGYVGEEPSGISWNEEGAWTTRSRDPYRLHDLPKKQVHWANDYGEEMGSWHDSREEADGCAGEPVIAVIRREWVEGQPPQYFTEEV